MAVDGPVTVADRRAYEAALRRDPCAYCGERSPLGGDDWRDGPTVDHIVPRSRGGEDEWSNLIGACWACNASKGTKSLLAALLRWELPCAHDLMWHGYDLELLALYPVAYLREFHDMDVTAEAARALAFGLEADRCSTLRRVVGVGR